MSSAGALKKHVSKTIIVNVEAGAGAGRSPGAGGGGPDVGWSGREDWAERATPDLINAGTPPTMRP